MHLIFKDNYSFKLNLQTGACLPLTIPACRRRLDRWWRRGEAIDQNAPWRTSLRLLSHSHYNTPLRPKISWQTDNVITSGMISCFAICITQSTAYYICSVSQKIPPMETTIVSVRASAYSLWRIKCTPSSGSYLLIINYTNINNKKY